MTTVDPILAMLTFKVCNIIKIKKLLSNFIKTFMNVSYFSSAEFYTSFGTENFSTAFYWNSWKELKEVELIFSLNSEESGILSFVGL